MDSDRAVTAAGSAPGATWTSTALTCGGPSAGIAAA